MWRLNVKKKYLERVLELRKFFINERHDFKPNEVLLIQLIKQDEPSRFLGRIRGIFFFERLEEDYLNESIKLYSAKWRYVILPNSVVRLSPSEWFNLEDEIGVEAAKKYYGQAEAIKLSEEDEEIVRDRLSQYLSS